MEAQHRNYHPRSLLLLLFNICCRYPAVGSCRESFPLDLSMWNTFDLFRSSDNLFDFVLATVAAWSRRGGAVYCLTFSHQLKLLAIETPFYSLASVIPENVHRI